MSEEKIIPNLQKEKIVEYLNATGMRLDGRKAEDFRDIEVKLDISKNAEASCSVKIGKTEVYAGVKMGLMTPYPDSPDEGSFMVTMELAPMASDYFEMGRPGIDSVEMGRVIDRGIRESGFLDFKKLSIEHGEKAWQVFVDLYAINSDGNVFDAAALAALIALGHAKMPVYNKEEDKVEHELSEEPLPLNKEAMSFNMTLHKIGDHIVVDPSFDEEKISDYRVSIAFADHEGKPRITAMQKGKAAGMTSEEMEKILNIIEDKFKDLFPQIKKWVFD